MDWLTSMAHGHVPYVQNWTEIASRIPSFTIRLRSANLVNLEEFRIRSKTDLLSDSCSDLGIRHVGERVHRVHQQRLLQHQRRPHVTRIVVVRPERNTAPARSHAALHLTRLTQRSDKRNLQMLLRTNAPGRSAQSSPHHAQLVEPGQQRHAVRDHLRLRHLTARPSEHCRKARCTQTVTKRSNNESTERQRQTRLSPLAAR